MINFTIFTGSKVEDGVSYIVSEALFSDGSAETYSFEIMHEGTEEPMQDLVPHLHELNAKSDAILKHKTAEFIKKTQKS